MNKKISSAVLLFFTASSLWLWGCPKTTSDVECGPPIASAGADLEGVTGQKIVLHGTFRLPPDDQLACQKQLDGVSFHWEQISGPDDVELENPEQVEASFVPITEGEYSFRCKAIFSAAKDPQHKESQWDTVKVNVTSRTCGPPVADAGQDQLLGIEQDPVRVELDGSRSQPAQSCPDLNIVNYTWSFEQKPDGSSATLTSEDGGLHAWFEADMPGDYLVRLEVQDSLDEPGRQSTDEATVVVRVLRRTPCEDTLDVEVSSAQDGTAISGAHIVVVDAQGESHQATTDASGMAHLESLAPGSRKSISVFSDEKVSALAGTRDQGQRNKYQMVSVLDQCSSSIHIPLPLTNSGKGAISKGSVVARIPQSIFDRLPHSQKLAGGCTTDQDCSTTYACKQTDMGDSQCTPKSLLPVFGIDDPNISGQFRGVLLTALQPEGSLPDFPVNALFAPPVNEEAFLPGNLATDDSFLNSLGPVLGNDIWGQACSTAADCPNTTQYACESDDSGEKRCKDTRPLTNIKLEVPVGQDVGLVMLLAVVDVGMENMISLLSQLLSDSDDLVFDVGSLLAAFQFRTIYVCPLRVDVQGAQTDITNAIAAIDPDRDCWSVPYRQRESIVPVPDAFAIRSDNACEMDSDCLWPDSGLRCLAPDDGQPSEKYCLMPLYRVSLISDNQVQLDPSFDDLNPLSEEADERVCSWLPAQSSHPKKCPGDDGRPQDCKPPEECQVDTPSDTSCSIPYGLAIVTADLPTGHQLFPKGGRMIMGFHFNVSPVSADIHPNFLLPPLEAMGASQIGAVQKYFRNIFWLPDKTYQVLAGSTSAVRISKDDVRSITLPDFPAFARLQGDGLDAGLDVSVWFEPKDPTASCQSMEYEQVWATANSMLEPNDAGHQSFVPDLVLSGLPEGNLAMLEIAKVDRVDPDQDGDIDSLVDDQWLVFVPPSSSSISLPMENSPFSSGDEIRLKVINSKLGVAYDHDLFPSELILHGQTAMSSDAYELMVP